MHKTTMSQANPTEMSPEELVVDYAKNKKMGDVIEDRMQALRQPLIEALDGAGIIEKDGCSVSLSKKIRTTVDESAVDALAKKKGIELGEVYYEIVPKKTIPEKVLKTLDEYFSLKIIRQVDAKVLDKAKDHGLISEKEKDKCLIKTPQPTLTAKVAKDVEAQIIEFYD